MIAGPHIFVVFKFFFGASSFSLGLHPRHCLDLFSAGLQKPSCITQLVANHCQNHKKVLKVAL